MIKNKEDRAVEDLERLGAALSAKRSGRETRRPRQVSTTLSPRFDDKPAEHQPVTSGTYPGLSIVIDTREQAPFSFDRFQDVAEVHRGTLKTGDYSLAGKEDAVAVERKELGDLINCLSHDRDRFERELARAAAGLRFFAVVCEGSWEDIARGRYRSQMRPESALQSIFAFSVRYHIPFIPAGSRRAAEYMTHGLLRQYAREIEKKAQARGAAA